MAVVYMRKLEQEPDTYDSKFTTLTKGVNKEVQKWILDRVNASDVLEIGCGTGVLAAKMALKGNNVIAIDKNFKMITFAMQNYPQEENLKLTYQIGTFSDIHMEDSSKDVVVSTFMLSELRPFEQQIFLRNAWKVLKPEGSLIIGAEFVPSGFWRLIFNIKRWWYKKKIRRLRLQNTFRVKWFFNYLESIGFKIKTQKKWKHGSIQALELQKVIVNQKNEPGYYRPKPRKFKGIKSQLRIYRCTFTGQVDHVPIEPGIYESGTPDKDSPIIVTANYDYTYIKVMRDLKKINAWVLCVDSNGINVWCAARGNNFGNSQLLEAVETSGIQYISNKKTLLLPQLSAGGIAIPELPKSSEKFPFKVKYGPVWSKFIPDYLKEKPSKKSDKMKLAKFKLSHRMRAVITHTTFLFRKVFLLPIIALFFLFLGLAIFTNFDKVWWIGEICLWVIITNLIIFLLFPLSDFTQKFVFKGIFYGFINISILGLLTWWLHSSILYVLINIGFFFWIAFFSTMSSSGYTMATSPRKIENEYPLFSLLNKVFLIIGLISLTIGVIFV
ncbi:MAG: methyltransferase domain-containing protein [Candidatus Heimdallarchaeota archaeon]